MNHTDLFVSVVVAAFNVERFLPRMWRNLASQTFGNFEVIIVDDGSTDSTGEIIDGMAVEDSRIVPVHQPNMGVGSARNAGMCRARGEYVWFYDADDDLEPDALERMIMLLRMHDFPEVLMFGYDETDSLSGKTSRFRFQPLVCTVNAEVRDSYKSVLSGLNFNNGFVWNKLYKRSFIQNHGIKFGDWKIQQDEIFNVDVYKRVDRLVAVPDILYHYFVYHKGNIRSGAIAERFDIYSDVKKSLIGLLDYWTIKDDDLSRYVHRRFLLSVITAVKCAGADGREIHAIVGSDEIAESVSELRSLGYRPATGVEALYFRAFSRQSVLLTRLAVGIDVLSTCLRGMASRVLCALRFRNNRLS